MILITSLILINKYSCNTYASVFYANKKFEAFKEVLIVQCFNEVGFLIILKRYIFTQLIFSQFVCAIVQYVLIT